MKSIFVSKLYVGIFLSVTEKAEFLDGKATGKKENVVLKLATECGDVQVLLPYSEKRQEIFAQKFSFGDKIAIQDVFQVEDIKISIYRDELSVKIYADYEIEE